MAGHWSPAVFPSRMAQPLPALHSHFNHFGGFEDSLCSPWRKRLVSHCILSKHLMWGLTIGSVIIGCSPCWTFGFSGNVACLGCPIRSTMSWGALFAPLCGAMPLSYTSLSDLVWVLCLEWFWGLPLLLDMKTPRIGTTCPSFCAPLAQPRVWLRVGPQKNLLNDHPVEGILKDYRLMWQNAAVGLDIYRSKILHSSPPALLQLFEKTFCPDYPINLWLPSWHSLLILSTTSIALLLVYSFLLM